MLNKARTLRKLFGRQENWTQVLVGNKADGKPFFISDVEVPQGEEPKDFIRIDYGDLQENTILFQKVATDPEERRVYYIRNADYKGDKLVWQLGDPRLEVGKRLRNSLKRLSQYTTDEDPKELLEAVALVLERISDDLEASKL